MNAARSVVDQLHIPPYFVENFFNSFHIMEIQLFLLLFNMSIWGLRVSRTCGTDAHVVINITNTSHYKRQIDPL